ncbi:MAG: hypothetical protein R3D32_10685 [Nitratireductor sp.]
MEQVEQLKAMRDAAKARIEALPDYRLMNSLTTLISELEEAFGLVPAQDAASAETGEEASASEAEDDLGSEPHAEPEGEAAEPAEVETVEPFEMAAQPDIVEETGPEAGLEMPAEDDEIGEIDFSDLEAEIIGGGEELSETTAVELTAEVDESGDSEDDAIRRAMQELEADLESVKL